MNGQASPDPEVAALWTELTRRIEAGVRAIPELRRQSRADLVAAFGEEDIAIAMGESRDTLGTDAAGAPVDDHEREATRRVSSIGKQI